MAILVHSTTSVEDKNRGEPRGIVLTMGKLCMVVPLSLMFVQSQPQQR